MKFLKWSGLLLFASIITAAEDVPGIVISFFPVGTPGFMGPPKIGEAGFVAPVVESIYQPVHESCLAGKRAGEYEALLTAEGEIENLHSLYEPVAGDECEIAHLFPYIMKWRFIPASYQGKAIPVYMRFSLSR